MITSSIELNNLHVKQIASIDVNSVAHVPLQAIWLQHPRKMVYSSLDSAYRDNSSGFDAGKRLMPVASIVEGLDWRLMPLLNNHHTSSLTYWPYCKSLNQGKKPFNAWFSTLDDETTLHPWGNASSSRLKVAIRTCPHPEKHCIITCWLMLSPPCGPNGTNHMNCMLVALNGRHRISYCVVPKVCCIFPTTEILIVIDVVCEASKSVETPSNVIL